MDRSNSSPEVERALARGDADEMIRQIDAYIEYFANGGGEWPEAVAEDFGEIIDCPFDDPDKALAYIVIALSRTDDAGFLGYMGAGPLEDLFEDPSTDVLERVVAEAEKSARFRWLLDCPYKTSIAESAWKAIEPFRTAGPHKEPTADTLPPR